MYTFFRQKKAKPAGSIENSTKSVTGRDRAVDSSLRLTRIFQSQPRGDYQQLEHRKQENETNKNTIHEKEA
jgi:hypothetical protein